MVQQTLDCDPMLIPPDTSGPCRASCEGRQRAMGLRQWWKQQVSAFLRVENWIDEYVLGSVGQFTVQLLHLTGYKVATVSSQSNFDICTSLGADAVFDVSFAFAL